MCGGIAALVGCIPLPLVWTDQVLLGALLIGISAILGRLFRGRVATLALTIISLFCTLRYFYWRWGSTLRYLNNNGWQ